MLARAWCWMVVVIYLAGCTTLTHQPYAGGDPTTVLKPGDHAVISTATGSHKFKVVRATADEICGDEECVPAEQIEQVQIEQVSVWKTAAMAVGIFLVVGLAAVAAGGIGFVGFPGPPVFP